MAVTTGLEELDKLDAYPTKEVLVRVASKLLQRLNAEYESLTDEGAPGAASQTLAGHDHSLDFGGSPIPRSSILCVDTGGWPHITKTETVKNQQTSYQIGPRCISPGLASAFSTYTDVMVFMGIEGGPVEIWAGAGEQNRVLVEPGTEDAPRWIPLRCPIQQDDVFSYLYLTLRPTTAASTTWSIYKINESESWALSIPEIGHRAITSTIGLIGTVYEYFGTAATLDDDLVAALETLDSYTLKILLWSLNALYTHTQDEAAPGTVTQVITGHDHYKITDGGFGGRPIPRGCIYYAGSREDPWMAATCAVQNQWEYADLNLVAASNGGTSAIRLSTGTPDPTTGTNLGATPMWEAYVSAGMTSVGVPSASPFLVAWVYIGGATQSGALRIYNSTAAALSPVSSFTTISHPEGWVEVTKVPCVGNVWNSFTLQILTTSASGPTYNVRQVSLHEVYHDENRDRATVTTSSGSGAAGVARSGSQKVPEE